MRLTQRKTTNRNLNHSSVLLLPPFQFMFDCDQDHVLSIVWQLDSLTQAPTGILKAFSQK